MTMMWPIPPTKFPESSHFWEDYYLRTAADWAEHPDPDVAALAPRWVTMAENEAEFRADLLKQKAKLKRLDHGLSSILYAIGTVASTFLGSVFVSIDEVVAAGFVFVAATGLGLASATELRKCRKLK